MEKLFGAPKPVVQAIPNQMPQQNQISSNNLQAPPNQQTQQTPQTSPNGIIPAQNMSEDDKQKANVSPMDKFGDLWQPVPTDPNAPNPESTGFSPEKMMEAAGKVDFSKVLNREDLQKISAGGEEAVNALMNALNKTAQTVFGQSTVVTQKLVERAVADAKADFLKEIPGLVKKQSLNESLAADNPAFSNPALQPVITALQSQLAEKYPKATTAELRTMAMEYLTGAAEMITPAAKKSPDSKSAKVDTNWDEYLA
jgi:hypothetical protein